MDFFLHLLINGIAVGFLYSMSAIGFVIIYKCSEVLNFAHGEIMALGALIYLTLITWANVPIWIGFFLTLIGSFILGFIIERIFLRPLMGQSHIMIIMLTVGLGSMLKGLMLLLWGGNLFTYPPFLPDWFSIQWKSIFVPPVYVAAFIMGIIFLIFFGFYFKYSSQGIFMRSVADNQYASLSLGVNVKRVLGLSWGIASLVVTISGITFGIINGINIHELGALGLKVFPVVILGGLDSITGAIVGGVIIGLIETFVSGYISPSVRDLVAYILLVLILMIKPYGLFGLSKIDRM